LICCDATKIRFNYESREYFLKLHGGTKGISGLVR
jgi:hypothetical protein